MRLTVVKSLFEKLIQIIALLNNFMFRQIRSRVKFLVISRFKADSRLNLLSNSRSQAGQDAFAQFINNDQVGSYVEIGAGDGISSSNTFVLEKNHWKGISVELNPELVNKFKSHRLNPIVTADATLVDYRELIMNSNIISEDSKVSYLQIDVDPPLVSLAVLLKIPFELIEFEFISFEHDSYYAGTTVRDESRQFLASKGYKLIFADVQCFGNSFEDWWVKERVLIGRVSTLEGKGIFSLASQLRDLRFQAYNILFPNSFNFRKWKY